VLYLQMMHNWIPLSSKWYKYQAIQVVLNHSKRPIARTLPIGMKSNSINEQKNNPWEFSELFKLVVLLVYNWISSLTVWTAFIFVNPLVANLYTHTQHFQPHWYFADWCIHVTLKAIQVGQKNGLEKTPLEKQIKFFVSILPGLHRTLRRWKMMGPSKGLKWYICFVSEEEYHITLFIAHLG